MFVRRTQTRTRLSGEPYFTHRLVRTERVDGRVKQVTLLNLGRHFDLPSQQWPLFCSRLSELLSPQGALTPVDLPVAVEAAAHAFAAQIQPRSAGVGRVEKARRRRPATSGDGSQVAVVDTLEMDLPPAPAQPAVAAGPASDLVHADTLEMFDQRSVAVEALALHAIAELGIADKLRASGFNRVSLAAAMGQIVARMAQPGSERATHRWLQQHSALGELTDYDFGKISLSRLYRVADDLWRQHDAVEKALYERLSTVFGLTDTTKGMLR